MPPPAYPLGPGYDPGSGSIRERTYAWSRPQADAAPPDRLRSPVGPARRRVQDARRESARGPQLSSARAATSMWHERCTLELTRVSAAGREMLARLERWTFGGVSQTFRLREAKYARERRSGGSHPTRVGPGAEDRSNGSREHRGCPVSAEIVEHESLRIPNPAARQRPAKAQAGQRDARKAAADAETAAGHLDDAEDVLRAHASSTADTSRLAVRVARRPDAGDTGIAHRPSRGRSARQCQTRTSPGNRRTGSSDPLNPWDADTQVIF
jgi:hypothetical protein